MADDRRRIALQNLTFAHLQGERFAAVEAGRFDPNDVAGEEPAHGQRFEASLGKGVGTAVD